METNYLNIYARPITKISIQEVNLRLLGFKKTLKNELEGLLFLRNKLNKENQQTDNKLKKKITDIINKLENIIINEVENISGFLCEIEREKKEDVDNNLYVKFELIRDNYNKIMLNISKMMTFSPEISSTMENLKKQEEQKSYEVDSELNIIEKKLKEAKDIKQLATNTLVQQDNKSNLSDQKTLRTLTPSKSNLKQTNPTPSVKSKTYSKTPIKKKEMTPQSNSNNNPIVNQNNNSFFHLNKELDYLKQYVKELEQTIASSKQKNFDKESFNLLNENYFKLLADYKIMKNDLEELEQNISEVKKKEQIILNENKSLREMNENLLLVIKEKFPEFNENYYFDYVPSSKQNYSNAFNKFGNEKILNKDNQSSKEAYQNTINSGLCGANYGSSNFNASNLSVNKNFETDGFQNTSSVDIKNFIKTNANMNESNYKTNSKGRFLIPKKD